MAEEPYVTRDQHRADLAQLHGEWKEAIAGVRQDVAVLAKTVEHLGQTMASGFADIRQAMTDIRQAMTDMRQMIRDLGARLDRQEAALCQDIREVRTTSQRQLWVLIGVVIVTMVGGMLKVVFFP
jgi:prophage DNA circulation protein